MTYENEKIMISMVGQIMDSHRRIADYLKRLADHIAPEQKERPKHTAVLGTATYTREEREKKELVETLRGKSPKVV